MKVRIKQFDVDMEVKNKGIEFAIYSPDGRIFLGDMILTKKGLIWCSGKTGRRKKSWRRVIEAMES